MSQWYSYAGFWKRVFAYVIDCFVLLVVLWAVSRMFPEHSINYLMYDQWGQPALSMAEVRNAGIVLAYMVLCHCSPLQGTIGKLMMGIKVVTLDGRRIGFIRALCRYIAFPFSGLFFCVGFFMAGFTQRKQALHDMICGTLVVNR